MVMSGEAWPSNFIRAGKLTPARSISDGIGMAKLVRDDACGEAERMADLMQVIAELTNERFFGARRAREPSIGGQRIKGAKESQALDEFADERIHRDHVVRF